VDNGLLQAHLGLPKVQTGTNSASLAQVNAARGAAGGAEHNPSRLLTSTVRKRLSLLLNLGILNGGSCKTAGPLAMPGRFSQPSSCLRYSQLKIFLQQLYRGLLPFVAYCRPLDPFVEELDRRVVPFLKAKRQLQAHHAPRVANANKSRQVNLYRGDHADFQFSVEDLLDCFVYLQATNGMSDSDHNSAGYNNHSGTHQQHQLNAIYFSLNSNTLSLNAWPWSRVVLLSEMVAQTNAVYRFAKIGRRLETVKRSGRLLRNGLVLTISPAGYTTSTNHAGTVAGSELYP
ncbi:unnamed protein product, partial [Amoebophrya sp. A120]